MRSKPKSDPVIQVSAVIITLNEAAVIGRCLASLAGVADEILVVDSGSADNTACIAEAVGARVLTRPFDGYGAQKAYAAQSATHNWILNLDADEALSPTLRESLLLLKATASPEAQAYAVNRLTFYCGKPIRHSGWYPDRLVRLWHASAGGIDPTAALHEGWVPRDPSARVGFLRGDLLHYSFPTVAAHREKVERYAAAGAAHDWTRGKKVSAAKRLIGPPLVFLQHYILRLGLLDGWRGFSIARLSARAAAKKYSRLRALQRTARGTRV